ncbi:MAG: hypothetical protein A2V86_02305 [Deltaproteobacteria bacterium RBG_16_49_23]|nr:MAG: hypothetical protein A2V86_02305 [Deltaproteobacteria bacterium RBG_16_49_23]
MVSEATSTPTFINPIVNPIVENSLPVVLFTLKKISNSSRTEGMINESAGMNNDVIRKHKKKRR